MSLFDPRSSYEVIRQRELSSINLLSLYPSSLNSLRHRYVPSLVVSPTRWALLPITIRPLGGQCQRDCLFHSTERTRSY